jgi:hypothetical protein
VFLSLPSTDYLVSSLCPERSGRCSEKRRPREDALSEHLAFYLSITFQATPSLDPLVEEVLQMRVINGVEVFGDLDIDHPAPLEVASGRTRISWIGNITQKAHSESLLHFAVR